MNFLFNLRVERTFNYSLGDQGLDGSTYALVADEMGEDSLAFLLEGVSKVRAERALKLALTMIETSTQSQIKETLLQD